MDLPPVVSKEKWEAALEKLRAREKQATRARDAPAASVDKRATARAAGASAGAFSCRGGKGSIPPPAPRAGGSRRSPPYGPSSPYHPPAARRRGRTPPRDTHSPRRMRGGAATTS